MSKRQDAYSLPVSPAWTGAPGGERHVTANRELREAVAIPRHERALELMCGSSLIATVYPRTRCALWRLHLLGSDEYLRPEDAPDVPPGLDVFLDLGEEPPADLAGRVPFRCVCGSLHELDRTAVLEAAERLAPRTRSAKAPRLDLRRVARVVRPD